MQIDSDSISLLGGMTGKILARYHGKGIFTILQLSHLFRLRRKRNKPQNPKRYLWELKALAIREKKTYVLQAPEIPDGPTFIYLDFEGLPQSDFIYLAGVLIRQPEKPDETHSFWADDQSEEEIVFKQLTRLLQQYPEAPIFHYGSYETKVFRKWEALNKESSTNMENLGNRMVNLLGWFRTHVYSPTYTNGLKEIAGFLGFPWRDGNPTGLDSIQWRNNWDAGREKQWKEKLIRYNEDDNLASARVHDWLKHLSAGGEADDVKLVSAMKKHSPYRLQSNSEYGEDFQLINKAAYFDYQRTKIYWRNEKKTPTKKKEPLHFGRGHPVWQPKKVNEIIQIPALENCTHCGHHKIYHAARQRTY